MDNDNTNNKIDFPPRDRKKNKIKQSNLTQQYFRYLREQIKNNK